MSAPETKEHLSQGANWHSFSGGQLGNVWGNLLFDTIADLLIVWFFSLPMFTEPFECNL